MIADAGSPCAADAPWIFTMPKVSPSTNSNTAVHSTAYWLAVGGGPAIAMPMFEIEGLSFGLQVPRFNDRNSDLFAIAAALRAAAA